MKWKERGGGDERKEEGGSDEREGGEEVMKGRRR